MDPNRSYLLIIGAMKAGTTILYNYISQHPKVCRCTVKEPEYFSSNLKHIQSKRAGKDYQRYEDLWNFKPTSHKFCIEASTGYTKYPFESQVPEKIKAYGIDPYFIYIVRDPYERIISQYNYMKIVHGLEYGSFDNPELISLSKYHMQLSQYTQTFDKKNISIIDFDELKTNPSRVVKQCFDFIKLNDTNFRIKIKTGKNETPYSKIDSMLGAVRSNKMINALLSNKARRPLQILTRKALPTLRKASPPVPKRTMNSKERDTVKNLLRQDILNFADEFSFDVEKWGF